MSDFTTQNEGSLIIMTPNNHEAQEWIDLHIPEDAQLWSTGIVIEPRYYPDIKQGILDEGMDIEEI